MKKVIMSGVFSLILVTAFLPGAVIGEHGEKPDAWPSTLSSDKPGISEAVVDDAKADPPGVLDDIDTAAIVDLGARLSSDRSWLTEATLDSLELGSLRLHELFADAPAFFTKDGSTLYRIEIERVGAGWEDFDPHTDPFAVYLTHETFTGLGRDRVLAFVEGSQTVLLEHDLSSIQLFALSVQDRPTDLPLPKSASVAPFEEPVALGKASLEVERFDPEHFGMTPLDGLSTIPTKAGCAHEVAPATCSGMHPVCGAGASLQFVLTKLKIRTDHEGLFKGNPEIELFPLNIDGVSTGTTPAPSTPLIFSGRTITDSAGRSRFLPDVNNTDVWYTINQGAAICPATLGNEWAVTLVEQDDTVGVLKTAEDQIIAEMIRSKDPTNPQQTVTVFPLHFLKLLKDFVELLVGLFSGDGDDLFHDSIGLTGDLFCNDGLNQPFPKVFNLASQEWDLQGYFACINPSCAPMTASVSGPSNLVASQSGTYSVDVGGGVSPFTYRWTHNGAFIGSGSSVSVSAGTSFTVAVTVTDAAGQTATASKNVVVESGGWCGEVVCL